MSEEEITRADRIKGMFCALMMGDCLGSPYEFYRWNGDRIYTDKVELETFRKMDPRYVKKGDSGEKRLPIGSVTDDTQMTITLLKSILENDGYEREKLIVAYGAWVHSKPPDIGNNTRFVFANKTVKGYESRIKKRDEEIAAGTRNKSLSNGALMRCSPIALLSDEDWLDAAKNDVKLSNPYRETIEVNILYLHVLRMILDGKKLSSVKRFIFKQTPKSKGVAKVIDDLKNDTPRNIGERDKGMAVHALWCSLKGLLMDESYAKTMRWVITQGGQHGVGDTDTNAAITGALIGARYGWTKLMKSKLTRYNWGVVINAAKNVTGPIKNYVPHDFDELMEQTIDRFVE